MFSSEVAGTSHEALLHGQDVTAIWHTQGLTQKFSKAANEALREVREILVTQEHTMEDICSHLGILPFHHNFFGNLVGCTLRYQGGHLQIQHPDEITISSFPVSRLQLAA